MLLRLSYDKRVRKEVQFGFSHAALKGRTQGSDRVVPERLCRVRKITPLGLGWTDFGFIDLHVPWLLLCCMETRTTYTAERTFRGPSR